MQSKFLKQKHKPILCLKKVLIFRCFPISNGVGGTAIDVATDRVKVINTLSYDIWAIDENHFTLVRWGCYVPDLFIKFNDNNKPEMHIHTRGNISV